MEGKLMCDFSPLSEEIVEDLGRKMAEFDLMTEDIDTKEYRNNERKLWHMSNAEKLLEYSHFVKKRHGEEKESQVREAILKFVNQVLPQLREQTSHVIHVRF